MDITAAFTATHKGEALEIHLTDGTAVTGDIISINSKGLNLKVDGKVRSFSLKRITDLALVADLIEADELADVEDDEVLDAVDADEEAFMDASEAEYAGDMFESDDAEGQAQDEADYPDDLEDIYARLSDGMTTADLAAALSDDLKTELTPKELRVHLRALGLGVGKGRKYSLAAADYRAVKDLINADKKN